MGLQDMKYKKAEVVEGLTVISPNLNVLVEIERGLGNLVRLENLTKIEDFRFILFCLAEKNRAYFDGDEKEVQLNIKQIGKMIATSDLDEIAKNLKAVIGETAEVKNSQGSDQKKPTQK